MKRSYPKILLCLIIGHCYVFNAQAQLTFSIDSVDTVCYGDYDQNDAWEDKTLYVHGPDVVVYGRLTNESEEQIILTLYENFIDNPVFKTLVFKISYRYKKDVSIEQDPLIKTDIFSYPYLNGVAPTVSSAMIDGKSYSYSTIKGGESIPIAFETLAVPEDKVSPFTICKTIRRQKKIAKAVKKTITVTPTVKVIKQDEEVSKSVLNAALSSDAEVDQYDSDNFVPVIFLDKKPMLPEGDKDGYCRWLMSNLKPLQAQLSGKSRRVLITFIVDKKGKVVGPEIRPGFSGTTDKIICDIIQQSSPWSPGELNGNATDSRISILLNINTDGTVMDIIMIGY